MYLQALNRKEKACFLALANYIMKNSNVAETVTIGLINQYEEELGYKPGFSETLPIPELKVILDGFSETAPITKNKIFLEVVGLLVADSNLFSLAPEQLNKIAQALGVEPGKYSEYVSVIMELKGVYQKIQQLIEI